jgi:hypothetical protein
MALKPAAVLRDSGISPAAAAGVSFLAGSARWADFDRGRTGVRFILILVAIVEANSQSQEGYLRRLALDER